MTPIKLKGRGAFPGDGFSQKLGLGKLSHSWWLASAQPDQRSSFIAAAKVRHLQRATDSSRPVYPDAKANRV